MVEANFPGRPFRLSERLWLIRQDIGGNASLLGYELWIYKNSYSPTFSSGKANRQYTVDGTAMQTNNTNGFDFRNGDSFLIMSGEMWIGHNADGTKTINILGAADYDSLGYTEVRSTVNLPTIPRASPLTFSPDVHSGIFGSAFRVNTNRASSSFEHDFDYWWGNLGQQAGPKRFTDYVDWVPPMSLLNQIPNELTGVGTARLYTYSAYPNGFIGTSDSAFRLTANNLSVDFDDIVITEATAGVAANVGAFVQGISKLKCVLTGATTSGYGATVKAYSLSVDGQSGSTATWTSPAALTKSGSVVVTGKFTDSRGLTKTKTKTVTVLAYNPPVINKVSVQRALSNGTVDDQAGTYLKVNVNASIKSLMVGGTEKNQLKYRISTRPKGSGTWTLKYNGTIAVGTTSVNTSQLITGPFSITTSHEVLVEIIDDFSTSMIQQTVPVAAIAQHWDGNRGVGIGKFRENGMLDVAGLVFAGGVNIAPTGAIMMWPQAGSAPTGWLRCYGTAISRVAYPDLFGILGTSFGSGDGSTTFNIPDFRGRAPVGYDGNQTEFNAMGKSGGAKTHTLTNAQTPTQAGFRIAWGAAGNVHFDNVQALSGPASGNGIYTQQNDPAWDGTAAGGGGSHNNLQPYSTINFIIKAY